MEKQKIVDVFKLLSFNKERITNNNNRYAFCKIDEIVPSIKRVLWCSVTLRARISSPSQIIIYLGALWLSKRPTANGSCTKYLTITRPRLPSGNFPSNVVGALLIYNNAKGIVSIVLFAHDKIVVGLKSFIPVRYAKILIRILDNKVWSWNELLVCMYVYVCVNY